MLLPRQSSRSIHLTLFVACLAAAMLAASAEASTLVSNTAARRHGLVRAWFSQVRLNPARNTVESASLDGDMLFVLTSVGSLQAFSAETGELVWSTRVGNPDYPCVGPVANSEHVAIVNGSTVHVFDRATGQEISHEHTTSAVAAAPALSKNYVYVPQFSGRIDAIGIYRPRPVPWYFTSHGRIFEDAVATSKSIIWSTDRGHLYVVEPDAEGVRFRFESATKIVAPASVHTGSIYVATMGGYVYSLDEMTGVQRWRYACGASVTKSPVVLGDTVFIASDEPALHCIGAQDGQVRWTTQGVSQFVAASPNRVYGLDRLGNILVLDREHGVVQSRARSMGAYQAVLNEQNDRLYLVTSDGLVQCFHEIGLDEPVQHAPKEELVEAEEPTEQEPTEEETPDQPEQPDTPDPFGGGGDDPFGGDAGGNDDPFGGSDNDPFGGGGDDPFGGVDPFGN